MFVFVIKVYINHRPAFGLDPTKLVEAFDVLGFATSKGSSMERGDLLDYLQTKGKSLLSYLTPFTAFQIDQVLKITKKQKYEINYQNYIEALFYL